MKRFILFALMLFPLAARGQLAAPVFNLTSSSNPAVTYPVPQSMGLALPTGATGCVGVNVTPTATTAGTCDSITGEFTYTAMFNALGTATFKAISTQVGHTNSGATSLTFTVPTFSTPAGTYGYSPVVTLYPDYFHVGGTACYTVDGTTPTESGNACTHGTTYSAPITVSSSLTLKVLFTKSGVSPDTTASAAYTVRSPITWFIRTDGGTEYSAAVTTGQCNGQYDAAYPGSGVNQNCAFNDVRYLWSDNSGAANAWVMAGGETAVIRGCTALAAQMNPSNPNCRLGYDNNYSGAPPNSWCGYGNPNGSCYNPPIPPGSAAQPTKILGQCAYGTYTCTPINNNYPYATHNEAQLFGGFGLALVFNLQSTSNVTIEGIELTTHNGVCTSSIGSPAYPRACSSGIPYDDFAQNGFSTNESSQNITLQDVYVHGFGGGGFWGPFSDALVMTRVFSGFNAEAGWNFDDDYGTNDANNSSIAAHYVTMIFNGCYEQYPITATYPAQVCYDTNSGGFGDSWSGQGGGGQGSILTSFVCDHCVDNYNTKDGFIGPHIAIPTLTITNSVAIGNMGANWKWGGYDTFTNVVTFQNNLTVNNCVRMKEAMAGVPSTYNMYLTGFCRAGGSGVASVIPIGAVWNLQNNTWISAQQIAIYAACVGADVSCASTINSTNNIFLGYTDPNNPYGVSVPTLYYLDPGIVLNASHNVEFGMQYGTCPSTANGVKCTDPLLLNEPSQTWVSEAALDVFNPFNAGNSFEQTSSSPSKYAGTAIGGLTTDYYGSAYNSPPSMGGVEYGSGPSGSYTLTVSTSGTGTGTINITNNCNSGSQPSGTLIGPCAATPDAGSVFAGWTGTLGCTGIGTCTAYLTANSTMNAVFNLASSTGAATMQGIGTFQGTGQLK